MNDLQEKVESNPYGRAFITGLIIFVLGTLFASNLSQSALQGWVSDLVQPVRNGLGLDQAWGVFSPDPRSTVYGLEARIRYDDGAAETWTWPKNDPFISEYRDYHWQKYSEQVRLDDQSALWRPFAEWIARTHDRSDRHPVEVTLVRRWFDLNPPGTSPSHGPWQEFEYFTLQVGPSLLSAGGSR
jgi:hypothetical protein